MSPIKIAFLVGTSSEKKYKKFICMKVNVKENFKKSWYNLSWFPVSGLHKKIY